MILVTFHVSWLRPLGLLFEQLPGKVVVLANMPALSRPRSGVEYVFTGGGQLARIAAAKKAGDVLRDGGFAFMLVDVLDDTARTPIEVFGQTFSLSSGAFRLARMTRAPVAPLITDWRERRLEIALGTPIAPAEETAMTDALASWLESVVPAGERRSRLINQLSMLSGYLD